MINYSRTVDSKPTVTDGHGNSIKDITASSLQNVEFDFVDITLCPTDFVMRPDLLAELKMGTMDKTEILLKANDISNPFTLNAGDILIIPDPVNSEKKFIIETTTNDPAHLIRKQYVDNNKAMLTNTGDSLQSFTDREKTKLPPNYSKTGDKEMMFIDGDIVLGPNVSRTVQEGEMPLEKQLYLNKIKKLING
jgi:hypothetical protein